MNRTLETLKANAQRMTSADATAKHDIYSDYAEVIVFEDGEGNGFGYIDVKPDGTYYAIAERSEIETASFDDAAQWLWDNWMQYSVY